MIYNFGDIENTYGIAEIDLKQKELSKLLKQYIKENEDEYNIDDFYLFLKNRKIKVKEIKNIKYIYF